MPQPDLCPIRNNCRWAGPEYALARPMNTASSILGKLLPCCGFPETDKIIIKKNNLFALKAFPQGHNLLPFKESHVKQRRDKLAHQKSTLLIVSKPSIHKGEMDVLTINAKLYF